MKRERQNARCPAKGPRRIQLAPEHYRDAFSFIELLVVLAIILVLATLYWHSAADNRKRQSQTDCQKNLQTTFIALDIYAKDHAGRFPEAAGAQNAEVPLALLVPRYTSDTSMLLCPGSGDPALAPGEPLTKGKISYAYYMGRTSAVAQAVLMSDRQVDSQAKAQGQLLFSSTGKPPGNNHDKYGGNLLFCDGHVQLSPPAASIPLPLTQGVVLLNPK